MPLLTVQVKQADYESYKARAADAGLTLSQWVRSRLSFPDGEGGSLPPSGLAAGPVRGGTGPAPSRSGAETTGTVRTGGEEGVEQSAPSSGCESVFVPEPNSAPTDDGADKVAGSSEPSGAELRTETPGYTPPVPASTAATSGTGVSTPDGAHPRGDPHGPAMAGAPAPRLPETRTATCNHPRSERVSRLWGTTCGACGRLVD